MAQVTDHLILTMCRHGYCIQVQLYTTIMPWGHYVTCKFTCPSNGLKLTYFRHIVSQRNLQWPSIQHEVLLGMRNLYWQHENTSLKSWPSSNWTVSIDTKCQNHRGTLAYNSLYIHSLILSFSLSLSLSHSLIRTRIPLHAAQAEPSIRSCYWKLTRSGRASTTSQCLGGQTYKQLDTDLHESLCESCPLVGPPAGQNTPLQLFPNFQNETSFECFDLDHPANMKISVYFVRAALLTRYALRTRPNFMRMRRKQSFFLDSTTEDKGQRVPEWVKIHHNHVRHTYRIPFCDGIQIGDCVYYGLAHCFGRNELSGWLFEGS